ncbi:hypothetical protein TIFTF001_011262 [Ficus carica]|uniref:Protein BIG GRAIN 1-like E n=1 Tax=Ficus carica TaxID=3494 RepID=A0AA88ALB0_FICCA|nr:hypothetical protein TIFTF001_011262 [Ficus carica]
MSVAGISTADHTDKLHKKSFHRRNDSGELDVFEAARYFSGYNEALGYNGSSYAHQKIMIKQEEHRGWRGRISLDMPMRNVILNHHHQPSVHHNHHHDHKQMIKDKKYKQPSSPGGRLASFLNSLFSQSASKKKKSKSTSTTQSMKDDQHDQEESPSGRRKRRSSISHFRSSSTTDSKSTYSSSGSGFRTPPPYNITTAQTPTKGHKDLRSFSEQKQVLLSLSKHNITSNGTTPTTTTTTTNDIKNKHLGNPEKIWEDKYQPSDQIKKGLIFRRFDEVEEDEGADSDSSSDLFELQNYDLGSYSSSGLPVYETTDMDNIKRSSGSTVLPISSPSL